MTRSICRVFQQSGQKFPDSTPAGLSHDVANKQDVHASPWAADYFAKSDTRVSRITVTFIWPGVCQVGFDFLDYIPAEHDGFVVRYLFILNKDADFPAGLDGIALINSVEGIGYAFQLLKPLYVSLEHFPARTRSCCGQSIGSLDEDSQKGIAAAVIVMCRYGLDYLFGFTVTLGVIGSYFGMRSLNLVVNGLSNIMKQPRPFRLPDVHAQFGGHYARKVGDFN